MVRPGDVVIVTGATGGIGRAIARAIADQGGRVVLACHPAELGDGESLARSLPPALALPVELTEPDSVQMFSHAALDGFGQIDGLVNNAGILAEKHFSDLDEDSWSRVLDINLTGTYRMIRALRQSLAASGRGSIVNMASQLAYTGAPNVVAYTASKAGLLGLTRALAHDLAPDIRVNAVAPGPIESPMNTPYMGDATWVERKVGKSVMRRFGTAEEVAAAVLFLLGPEASYFTGQTLSPNGGGVMP
ncbi:SDR family NAD(P)-dependent oxidoreductase [Mycobacterium sp. NPDC003449]